MQHMKKCNYCGTDIKKPTRRQKCGPDLVFCDMDCHHLQARKLDKSDYPAADMLMDLQKAITNNGTVEEMIQHYGVRQK